jgi:hypothetical protein
LENEYGYSKTIISTDYKFDTINDAKLIMGFFFGEWIESEIEKIIPQSFLNSPGYGQRQYTKLRILKYMDLLSLLG